MLHLLSGGGPSRAAPPRALAPAAAATSAPAPETAAAAAANATEPPTEPPTQRPARPDQSIFVSLSSFRDRECAATLRELYANADEPHKLFVGVVEQNDPANQTDETCTDKGLVPRPWLDTNVSAPGRGRPPARRAGAGKAGLRAGRDQLGLAAGPFCTAGGPCAALRAP